MGNLSAYNTSTFSGSFDRGNINVAISSSIVSGSTGNIRFGDTPYPPSGGMVIISDSNTQLGIASASATPQFWIINNLNDTASVLNTINALPERINQTRFVTTSSAYLYLVSSSKYFPILGTEPLNTPVTNGLIVYLDAGQLVSYPTTASSWYDISGTNNNGVLTNGPIYSNGSIIFDGIDDYASFTLPNSLLMPTFTVCSVVTPITVANNGTVVLTNESARLNLGISYGGASGAYFFVTGNNGQSINGTQASYNFSFGTNTKYFVTWVVDIPGKSFQFWVNGTQIWSSNADLGTNFNNPSTNAFVLASRYGGGSSQVNIGISNFQFYNRVLSSSEINQNYYQAPIVTDSLIFAADAGNIVSYQSGSATTYSLTGSASGSLINGTGYNNTNGGIWNFDGIDDYINLGNQPSWNTPTGTMAAWVKITGVGADIGGILTNQTTGFNLHCFFANNYNSINQTVSIVYGLTHTNPNVEVYASSTESANSWLYIVGTRYYNGTNTIAKLYVNGVLKSTVTLSGSIEQTANDFALGRFYGTRAMIGNVAVTQIYSKELSAAEVSQNFNAQRQRFGI